MSRLDSKVRIPLRAMLDYCHQEYLDHKVPTLLANHLAHNVLVQSVGETRHCSGKLTNFP